METKGKDMRNMDLYYVYSFSLFSSQCSLNQRSKYSLIDLPLTAGCDFCRWGVVMPAIVAKSIAILSDAGLGMAMFSLGKLIMVH